MCSKGTLLMLLRSWNADGFIGGSGAMMLAVYRGLISNEIASANDLSRICIIERLVKNDATR